MPRRPNPLIPSLELNPRSACPLYRQLYSQLRQAILDQTLPPGTRLPSTRSLARALGLSRNTVLNAYESLIADALLAARRGSATRVRSPLDPPQHPSLPTLHSSANHSPSQNPRPKNTQAPEPCNPAKNELSFPSFTSFTSSISSCSSLAPPMHRPFDLWVALREARFPSASAFFLDPDGNPLFLHR